MTVRVNKDSFNLREKLSELERPIGLKGSDLMSADTAQEARDFISAGRKNLIINGDMRVAQRGTSTTVSDNSTYFTVDRFAFYRGGLSTTLTGTQQSVTDLPEHTKSLRIASTGNATIGANTDGWLKYNIEDKDFDNVNWINGSNKNVTLSFWAKSNRTGQFSVNISAGNFSTAKNIRTYTLDFADTWKKIEVTFPAPSTWAYSSSNRGAIIYWSMALGTTYYTSNPNTGWTYSNNKIGTVGDTQIYGDDGAYFEVTGVQLEVGKNATDFEHRSIGEELALCQRYFYKIGGTENKIVAPAFSPATSEVAIMVSHPVTMRTAPTAVTVVSTNNNNTDFYFRTINNTGTALTGSGRDGTTYSTEYMLNIWFNGMTGMPQVPGLLRVQSGRTAHIHVSAEL